MSRPAVTWDKTWKWDIVKFKNSKSRRPAVKNMKQKFKGEKNAPAARALEGGHFTNKPEKNAKIQREN